MEPWITHGKTIKRELSNHMHHHQNFVLSLQFKLVLFKTPVHSWWWLDFPTLFGNLPTLESILAGHYPLECTLFPQLKYVVEIGTS